jgi:biotin-(acetyl-CoA carboxylase) ligase
MPPERRICIQGGHTARGLDLPPPFRLVSLREAGDAFAYARTHAAELGAGTLISVGRFDLAEFAVVLEPDDPFRLAWRALYAGMLALADALASVAPPKVPIAIEWPDAVRLGGALVGGGRLAWPDGSDAAEPPAWLVFGAMIRTVSMTPDGAGLRLLAPDLDGETSTQDDADCLIESFARRLMGIIDRWQESGFASIADAYIARLASAQGVPQDIGDNGDLVVTRRGKPAAPCRLQPLLGAPSWLDPASGGPRG